MKVTKESRLMGRFIIQNHKATYERLKRECKHQIMVTNGAYHAVVATLKECVVDTSASDVIPMSLNFEIKVMLVENIAQATDHSIIYATPMVLYQPAFSKCDEWAKSTAARKAFIKDVLKDLNSSAA